MAWGSAVLVIAAAVGQAQVTEPVAVDDMRPPLWSNLRVGMTKAEVKSLYPKLKTEITSACRADIEPVYKAGGLSQVHLSGVSAEDPMRCATTIRVSLEAKYGKPGDTTREMQRPSCGYGYGTDLSIALARACRSLGGETPYWIATTVWEREGLFVGLTGREGDENSWTVTYERAVTPSDQAKSNL